MGQAKVNLNSELHLVKSNLDIVKTIWERLFSKYIAEYDKAHKRVTDTLSSADSPLQDKLLGHVVGFLADKVKGATGVFGDLAGVVSSGLTDMGVLGKSDNPKQFNAPSSVVYGETMKSTSSLIVDQVLIWNNKISTKSTVNSMMDADAYHSAKSRMLSSPFWYPPYHLLDSNAPVGNRIEKVLWCRYFLDLADANVKSWNLRFLDDIIEYIDDKGYFTYDELQAMKKYPTPITQGGPGDWSNFPRDYRRLFTHALDQASDAGWIVPLPKIPDDNKVQKSVNWKVPKTERFPHPSGKGTGGIRIDSVEMTLYQKLDWKDVPAINWFLNNK